MKRILRIGLIGTLIFVLVAVVAYALVPSQAVVRVTSADLDTERVFSAHLRNADGETVLNVRREQTPFEVTVEPPVEGEFQVLSPDGMVRVEIEVTKLGKRKLWGQASGTNLRITVSRSTVAFNGR
jgi:hypothetical protein